MNKAAVNMGHKYLFDTLFSFPLDVYPEVGSPTQFDQF